MSDHEAAEGVDDAEIVGRLDTTSSTHPRLQSALHRPTPTSTRLEAAVRPCRRALTATLALVCVGAQTEAAVPVPVPVGPSRDQYCQPERKNRPPLEL